MHNQKVPADSQIHAERIMINLKLFRSKILLAVTFGLALLVLCRCLLAIRSAYVPLDYWLYGALGVSGCILALIKNKWARLCILGFYALQVFFINTPFFKLYYHVGFYYARHASTVKPDLSQFPLPGVSVNLVGVAMLIFAFLFSLYNDHSVSGDELDWQCPECGLHNDYSLIRCKCGYEDEE